VETTTNRNDEHGAWIRHVEKDGTLKPGDLNSIDWKQWLGETPEVPFSIDRFYNWTKWFNYDFGMFGQLFSHEFDAVNQLLNIGIPKSAVASGGIYRWKDNREIPDVLNAIFEYPEHELTLMYSATLSSSRQRGRVFMGIDASMELGGTMEIKADSNSEKYKKLIADKKIDTSALMVAINPGSSSIDAVSSATEKYYSSRGLTSTYINGRKVDTTHLHIKEWIDCIRSGGVPTANIEKSYQEGITTMMGHKAYMEKRLVEWDPVNRKIV
jgi:predicted dehydrogenase